MLSVLASEQSHLQISYSMWSGFLALAALSSITLARIEGISAPKTIVANQDFEVTLITGNYIQSVKDLVAAFALTPRVDHGGFIGSEYLGSFFLGPGKIAHTTRFDLH